MWSRRTARFCWLRREQDQTRRGILFRAAFFGRTIMNHRMTKWAVAAVVALAVIAGWSSLCGRRGRQGLRPGCGPVARSEYADLQSGHGDRPAGDADGADGRRVQRARSQSASPRPTVSSRWRCRRRTGMEGISIVPVTKSYVKIKADNLPDGSVEQPVGDDREDSGPCPPRRTRCWAANRSMADARWIPRARGRRPDDGVDRPGDRRLVRVELEFANAPGMNMIMSDFQLDVPLDDSLFSLEPPQGYTPVEVQADASTVTERDFIEFLRFWSVWTRDATFPPIVAGAEIAKVTVQMAREDKFVGPCPPGYEPAKQQDIMYRGLLFVAGLPTGTWRYAGQNVPSATPPRRSSGTSRRARPPGGSSTPTCTWRTSTAEQLPK